MIRRAAPTTVLGLLLSPPAIVAIVLAAASVVRIVAAQPQPRVERYHASVAEVIDRFPFRIGGYLGRDAELSRPAVELLNPNRIIQRTFDNLGTGLSCSVVLVHCKDVRDMVGHYPPVCYPSAGWRMTGSSRVELQFEDRVAPAMRYRFVRSLQGVERRIEMVNFFVLPRQPDCFAPDMDALNALAAKPRERQLGSAQIQIIVPEGLPDGELSSFLAEILSALRPTMDVVSNGVVDG